QTTALWPAPSGGAHRFLCTAPDRGDWRLPGTSKEHDDQPHERGPGPLARTVPARLAHQERRTATVSLTAFVLLGVTVLVAAFVQGSAGMGSAMIAAPVGGLLDPTLIPVLLLVLMIPLNAYVAWRERSALDWRGVRWISVGRFAGTFLGLWILLVVSLYQLSLLIGISTRSEEHTSEL